MNLTAIVRIIKFALQDLGRNVWLTTATVSVLTLTLVSVNILISANVLGQMAVDTIRGHIDVSVHLRPEVDESRVQSLKIALLSLPQVRDVELVTPAQALERFSEIYGSDPAVLAALGEVGDNPFGATLVVRARQLDDYAKIMAQLDDPAFSEIIEEKNFDDRQAMIARITAVAWRIQISGLAASLLFVLITLLIVFNTIRVSIYTRREEISMMRLVGASDGFIRGPFYVQAIVWSMLSVGISLTLVWPVLHLIQPYISRFFGLQSADLLGFFQVNFLKVFGAQLVAVALMAVTTTKLATARYLRI